MGRRDAPVTGGADVGAERAGDAQVALRFGHRLVNMPNITGPDPKTPTNHQPGCEIEDLVGGRLQTERASLSLGFG